MSIPRPEYPRPQFKRENWTNLNGAWQFDFDFGMTGKEKKLYEAETLSKEIIVPFCPESDLSGIGYKDFIPACWYKKEIDVSIKDNTRYILHFGACDFETEVWVNGESVGTHIGGYISFSFDITEKVKDGKNIITVYATDDLRSHNQPAGKQCHKYNSFGCFYTRTTGIWQTVWLEEVPVAYIKKIKATPDIENKLLRIEADCVSSNGLELKAESFFDGIDTGSATAKVVGRTAIINLPLKELHLWEIGSPLLYDLVLTLGEDKVESYFGMRSVCAVDGKLFINGKGVYQRLILDQGFYPDGIYTAPTDAELIGDIKRSMELGFNGARLHEKIFEERFLYYCDRLGYIVWGEHANWGLDIGKPEAWRNFVCEWLEELQRDYNHPAIIGWCPLNETEKNQDPAFVRYLVEATRAFYNFRPVIDCSGWFHVDNVSDFWCMHDYDQKPESFRKHYAPLEKG
ncbi:MAG: beta-galactosidase, partial [Clostridia bacterium]|nr:beta-galactosidase [Clostridia bacterium]